MTNLTSVSDNLSLVKKEDFEVMRFLSRYSFLSHSYSYSQILTNMTLRLYTSNILQECPSVREIQCLPPIKCAKYGNRYYKCSRAKILFGDLSFCIQRFKVHLYALIISQISLNPINIFFLCSGILISAKHLYCIRFLSLFTEISSFHDRYKR